jgi:hypothetical protein
MSYPLPEGFKTHVKGVKLKTSSYDEVVLFFFLISEQENH